MSDPQSSPEFAPPETAATALQTETPRRLAAPAASGLTPEGATAPEDSNVYHLREALGSLYGSGAAPAMVRRLQKAAAATAERVREHPTRRELNATDQLLITYGDSLQREGSTPLEALKRFADTRLSGALSGIHVLPFFPFSSDDGFAVIDYLAVRDDLGDWNDVRALAEHFDLMVDLVINHCSREHLWFADFVGDRAPGKDFFIESDPRADHAQVTRPRNSPVLTRVHTYRGVRHVWTTFSEDQVDLNFANPNVFMAFADILLFYLEQRARFIRLDAVAFLWKRLGTNCMSLPETHTVVRALRSLLDMADLPALLLTETNVPHAENVSYFGKRNEAHLVYQFSLAPLLLYSFMFEDCRYLARWAKDLDPAPPGCAYLNFLASHDGIGLRPLEGLVPPDAVQALIDRAHDRGGYSTLRTLADGTEAVYELNVSLFSAFGGTMADVPRYLAAHYLMLAFQGVPALYVHSLFGTRNDHDGVERTGRTRSINRAQLDVDAIEALIDDAGSTEHKIFSELRHALRVRREQPAFDPSVAQQIVDLEDPQLFALRREGVQQQLLVVASFAAQPRTIALAGYVGGAVAGVDLLTGERIEFGADVTLSPFRVLWLELR